MKPHLFTGLSTNKRYLVVALASVFALSGCDDKSDTVTTAAEKSSSQTSAPQTVPQAAAQPASKMSAEALAKRYAGKEVSVLDASELQLDGASALVVTFSVPLAADQDFSQFAHLVDVKEGKLDGGWELSDNQMELRLRHLPPSRELRLTLDPGIKAINQRTLNETFEHKITTANIIPTIGFASKGSLLPSKFSMGLPVIALNVDKVDVNFFALNRRNCLNF